MIATIAGASRAVEDFVRALLHSALWIGLACAVLFGIPLIFMLRCAHRDQARAQRLIDETARTAWAPLLSARDVLRRGADRARQRAQTFAKDASHIGGPGWGPLVCVSALIVLVAATYFGIRTEQATLQGAGNVSTVRWWFTVAIFAAGFVGGSLVMEALGWTHHLATHQANELRAATRIGWQRRTAFALVGLLLLAVPCYALATGAQSRARDTVRYDREVLADHGWLCDPEQRSLEPGQAAPGYPISPPNEATADCGRLAARFEQNLSWGWAGAAAMALLDVVLGWSLLTTAMWALGAICACTALGLRGTAGLFGAAANTIDRAVMWTRALIPALHTPVPATLAAAAPPPASPPTAPTGPHETSPVVDIDLGHERAVDPDAWTIPPPAHDGHVPNLEFDSIWQLF